MTTFRKHLLIGMTALGLGAGSLTVYAQKPAAETSAASPAAAQEHGRFHGRNMENFKQRMEKRQADLHDKLKLSASQDAAWKTYIEKMKPAAPTGTAARPDKAEWAKLSAPERMEKMHVRMQQREQKMGERVAATKEFYAVLTPEQQKVFNDSFHSGKGHKHGRHGHGHDRK